MLDLGYLPILKGTVNLMQNDSVHAEHAIRRIDYERDSRAESKHAQQAQGYSSGPTTSPFGNQPASEQAEK